MNKNANVQVTDNMLTVTIDLSKSYGPSASGKTTIIGTTGGNPQIATVNGKPVFLGVNCYAK
jgi:hypothetical protein